VVNYQYQVYIQPFKDVVHANFIGNYFRSHVHNRPPIRVFDNDKGYDGNSSIYYKDNYDVHFRPKNDRNETDIRIKQIRDNKNDIDGHIKDRKNPYPFFQRVVAQPVHHAYQEVLKYAGANYPHRDSADKRVIAFIQSGKAPTKFVNDPFEVGGWPILHSGRIPKDSDSDGMPDAWEERHHLNPHNSDDRNEHNLSNLGYTNLEIYLNSLVKK